MPNIQDSYVEMYPPYVYLIRAIDAFYCRAARTKGGAVITLGNNATYYSTVPRWDDDFN